MRVQPAAVALVAMLTTAIGTANADTPVPVNVAQSQDAAQQTGTPITIDVRQVTGSEALAVSGRAFAGRSLQLTAYATFSRDLPDVVLVRKSVIAGAAGAYATIVPIAPAFMRGTLITIVASTPGGSPATATFTVGSPNVTVPPDNLPNTVR